MEELNKQYGELCNQELSARILHDKVSEKLRNVRDLHENIKKMYFMNTSEGKEKEKLVYYKVLEILERISLLDKDEEKFLLSFFNYSNGEQRTSLGMRNDNMIKLLKEIYDNSGKRTK